MKLATTPVFATTLTKQMPGFPIRIGMANWCGVEGLPYIVPRGYKLEITVTEQGLVLVAFRALEEGV